MKLAKLIKPVELVDMDNSLYHLNFPHVSDILKPLDLTSEIMNNIQNHEDHLMAREKNEESEREYKSNSLVHKYKDMVISGFEWIYNSIMNFFGWILILCIVGLIIFIILKKYIGKCINKTSYKSYRTNFIT